MTLPSHIGQYRILRKLGAGGMGLVYLGEHTLLGRRAAIKTLLPTMSSNAEIVERFFNEARATSAISDSGVVQVFDFGYHVDGTAYIVMELLEGEALSARIARLGKIKLGDALRIARQIAGSLAAAHACEIVHRDLKPDNIFLVADAEAQGGERSKVLDFGICKLGTGDVGLTQTGAMVGTPVYMSPEQCRGLTQIDGRADIYAFGCLLFHMLTGRPPFVGEASGELIVAHLDEPPPAPSDFVPSLPPLVDTLVLRCLAKDPDDRFGSMTELQQALGQLADGCEISEAPDAAARHAMPLGRGFRSVYDGNFTAGGQVPLDIRQRLPWSKAPSVPGIEDVEVDDDRAVVIRGAGLKRTLLGSVVALGMAFGVVATSYIVTRTDRSEAAVVHAPVGVGNAPHALDAAPQDASLVAPVTVVTRGNEAVEPPTEMAPEGDGAQQDDDDRARDDGGRYSDRPGGDERVRDEDRARTRRVATKARARRAARSLAVAAPSSAPSAPASAPSNPSSEELYESR